MRWPTARWGEGYPGWHIECSAMATKYLGEQFDIHTGGIDNVFPHHEDEIAQSEALSGLLPARHWVHGAHLLMAGHKMAKSAGNFLRITELEESVEPLAFRLLCLTSRYRAKINVSDESLRGAQAGLESLRARARAIGQEAAGAAGPGGFVTAAAPGADGVVPPGVGSADPAELGAAGRAAFERWSAAVDDNLDLPRALAALRDAARDGSIPAAERRWLLLEADRVLGLDLARELEMGATRDAGPLPEGALPAGAEELLRERAEARAAKAWARADALRAALGDLGVEVLDRAGGAQDWRVRER
jgi:cysteinyl-tRNA synthetase